MTWQQRDHYDLLEVERDAARKEITVAYRLQMQAWAEDKFPPPMRARVKERAQWINAAYEELHDAKRRERYDATLAPPDEDIAVFPEPIQKVSSVWKRISKWMKDEDVGTRFDRNIAFTAGDYLERRREPSEKQVPYMLHAWEVAMEEGFPLDEDDIDEDDD